MPCEAALLRAEYDEALLLELCDLFLTTTPLRLDLMRLALSNRDAELLFSTADTYAAAANVFGATELVDAAHRLAGTARAGAFAQSADVWDDVEHGSHDLLRVLLDFREHVAPTAAAN